MGQRIGGSRRKTRHKLSKRPRDRGKISLTKYFQTFKEGDHVTLSMEPGVREGTYPARFMGMKGIVQKKKGRCYYVQIKDGGVKKKIIVHPAHLVKPR